MVITDIIKQEYKKVLNEGYVYQDPKLIFTDAITTAQFINYDDLYPDFDPNLSENNVSITWGMSFWLTENGIENMIIQVKGVEGTVNFDLHDKQSDELKQTVQKNLTEYKWNYQTSNAVLQLNGSLYVNSATFDFKTKIAVINF